MKKKSTAHLTPTEKLLDMDFKYGRNPDWNSICVDAGFSFKRGECIVRVADTVSRDELYLSEWIPGTTNIGEYLAICIGMRIIQEHINQEKDNEALIGLREKLIYSDSEVAIRWVKEGYIGTGFPRKNRNKQTWDLLNYYHKYSRNHPLIGNVMKWQTKKWGENPADLGRK